MTDNDQITAITAQDIRRAAEDLAQSYTEHRNTRDDLDKGGEAAAIARYWQEVYEAEYDKAEPIIEAIGKRWWTIYMLAEGRYWQMTGKPAAIVSLVMPWRRLLSTEKEAAAA